MAKLITGTNGSEILPNMSLGMGRGGRGNGGMPFDPSDIIMQAPSFGVIIPLFLFVVASGFLIAWSRVKAVEVV